MSSARSGGVPGRRARRRVERPSTAPFVDRSWDQAGAEDLFSLGERSPDERRERDADSVELNEEFWISEKPPHWG
ncbi:hypothetical protein [Corynebacterium durum]|uniref:Uncharacterized protein n=1 Tax=Corynebacterium durum F0235 TaxID=1035195 RepID=L1MIV3_9CORY|nr:hypothetical protein [Corynebacterium durum]EKX90864.1 hypothetical protein HMPREF9997_00928 [Corynebacterium durum F0235]NYI72827.1 hypothetical protein [Corynebacterium durum]WJY84556.1 hypothetical protein CDUR_04025 [Corynebacterium durum]